MFIHDVNVLVYKYNHLQSETETISPRHHVVFDDLFDIVSTTFHDPTKALNPIFTAEKRQKLVQVGLEQYLPPDASPPPLN